MHVVIELLLYALDRLVGLIPWFMFAVVFSVLLQHMRVDVLVGRSFRKRTAVAIVLSTAVGAFSPLCSCTVIPLIRGFLAAGVPVSVAMAFWIASPSIDPEIFGLTAAALGMPVAVARLLGALLLSLAAGFVTLFMERRGWLDQPLRLEMAAAQKAADPVTVGSASRTATGESTGTALPDRADDSAASGGCCGSESASPPVEQKPEPWWPQARAGLAQMGARQFGSEVLRDVWLLGRWMIVAVLAEALIVKFVPPSIVTAGFGDNVVLSVVLAAAIGVPLYLNGVGAIPVVGGLMATGMSPAAATTFLLGGAVTTIPAIAAVRVLASNRVFLLYLGIGFFGSMLVGLVTAVFVH